MHKQANHGKMVDLKSKYLHQVAATQIHSVARNSWTPCFHEYTRWQDTGGGQYEEYCMGCGQVLCSVDKES